METKWTKKIGAWLWKNIFTLCLIALIVMVVVDMAYVASYFRGEFSGSGYISPIIDIVFTVIYLVFTVYLFQVKRFERFSSSLSEEMNQLYFHGFRLWRWVDTDAFIRFQDWAESGICYELSILAMMALKGNPSATLYRGDFIGDDGKFKTHHAWVEFKVPGHGWCVADFSWILGGFAKKSVYMKNIEGNLIPKWSCSYDEFWSTEFVKVVYRAAKTQKTSHLLLELAFFGNPDTDNYGFHDICSSANIWLQFSDGSYMPPFVRSNGKEISSAIIRDFVKKEGRKQPRTRSIRLTHLGVLEYQKWCARYAVQPA